nr:endonuclease III [Entomobacter blattae]
MTKNQVFQFMQTLERTYPSARSELEYKNPFTLLVAVVLSAQATDVSVNKATPALFKAAPTPDAMVALGEEKISDYIRSIGLWRSKAHNVYELCKQLVMNYKGEVPSTRQALEALPGVGRKTANVVLNIAFGEPTLAVDTHIFRVGNRTGLGPGTTPLAVEQQLLKRIPKPFLKMAHFTLILLGRYTCKARKPLCYACPVAEWCQYTDKTTLPS